MFFRYFKVSISNICLTAFLLLSVGFANFTLAQTAVQNLNGVNIDNLSDDQVRQIIRQVESSGLPESQIEQVAMARGLPADQVSKLRSRVELLKKQGSSTNSKPEAEGTSNSERKINDNPDEANTIINEDEKGDVTGTVRAKIFGSDLFSNKNMTFEPNLRIATPKNYIVGPDDELLIDITGDNEARYNLTVNPEGSIRIEYVGIVALNGLTIEQATAKIKSRLTSTYPGISSGRTKVSVGIGNIRSIRVTLLGEVTRPGTYTLSSLSNVFNALYVSGGPNQNGSFREIEVMRGGKVVTKLDVYDFLLRGFQKDNIRLQDQDIIRIPVYNVHAELTGEIKRPAIFEVLANEHLGDLITFAGGFTDQAYRAKIKVLQNTDKERKISDVYRDDYSTYTPQSGDKYFVDAILDRFENRVVINGAVFRPGQFELTKGLTLQELIKKADGVTEDAFLPRGYITRLKADNSIQLISFDLEKILKGSAEEIPLQREDVVNISSIFDLREEYSVSISGEVRQPGTVPYADNMTLNELILQSGGFTEAATPKRIEISRRVKDADVNDAAARTATVFQVDVDKDLSFSNKTFILQPFDIIIVRSATGYEVQRQVKIEGEVLYPGLYTITRKDERVSDLLNRAGGFTALAYPSGASLKRPGTENGTGRNKIDKTTEDQEKLSKLQRLQETIKDSVDIVNQQELLKNVYVGINLDAILAKPNSKFDLILEEGDILRVPKQLQTVKVSGEVLFPITTIFNEGRGFKQYISQAGGFSEQSLKSRAYIIYANGAVKSTKKFLFFNNYPLVKPGAEIFVPKKAETKKLTTGEIVGITSGFASLAAIILGMLTLLK